MEEISEPIIHRLHKLKDAINSCGINFDDAEPSRHLLAHEGLLDAVVVLYDECNSSTFIQTPVVTAFIKKYDGIIQDIRRLRVNINDFEQKTVIGKGNFGFVQVVREKQTGNVYAMKTLRKSQTLAQQHMAFYEEERDIMAKCDSQWITKLQYTFQDEKNLYLVMEFHPGGDLLSLLDRFEYSFTEDMIQFYLSEIVTSLHVLHTMGYVHRDVKPENILIDRCGHVKLVDFGSAAKLSKAGFVESKMAIGTPDYLAPEVLSSMNERKDSKSSYGIECDLWSVGIMAYEMFYGETPFHAENVASTYNEIMNFKTSLKFNNNIAITPEFKSLIKGLLCDDETRISYNEFMKHKFFLFTDWHNLQSVRPPFIPVVSSLDDTSNFEDFDDEKGMPDIEAFRTRGNESGKDLPFIGFTYVRETNSDRSRMSKSNSSILNLEESRRNSTHLEEQLTAKKKELHEVKLHMKGIEGGENCRKMQQYEKRAVLAETKLSLNQKERTILDEELNKKEQFLQKARLALTNEKSQRAKTESKTLEFLRDIKEKWKREEAYKISNLVEKIEELKLQNSKLQETEEFLLEERNLSKSLQRKLDNNERDMQNYIQTQSKRNESFQGKEAALQTESKKLHQDVKDLNKEKEDLKGQLSLLSNKEGIQIAKITELEDLMSTLNGTLGKLESKKSPQEECLKAQFELLERQLKICQTKSEVDREKLHIAEDDLRKESKGQNSKLQEMEGFLMEERNLSQSLKRKLDNISRDLHKCLQTQAKRNESYQCRDLALQTESKKLQQDVTYLSKEKEDLQGQLALFSNREGIQIAKITELEDLMNTLKGSLGKIESKKSPQEESMKAQFELLEKQLKISQSTGEADREKLHIAEDTLRKKQREFTDIKLDFRGSERELKSTLDTLQFLRENNRELRAQLKEREEQIKVLQTKECELYEESKQTEGNYKNNIKEKEDVIKEYQNEITGLKLDLEAMDEIHKTLEDSKCRLKEAQSVCDEAKVSKRAFEYDLKSYERKVTDLENTISSFKESNEQLQEKLNGASNMIQQLKDICSEQDEQLGIVDRFHSKLQQVEDEKKILEDQIDTLLKDLKASKVNTNEETSLKLFQEKKVRDMEKKLNEVEEENEAMTMSLQQVKDDCAKELADTHQQINDLQMEMSDIHMKLRACEHQIIDFEGHTEILKDENAGHIQHIHNMKESNFMLTDGLEEAISKAEMFKKRIVELEHDMAAASAISADKDLRMGSTIKQQTKLIDFLQCKTENPPKKKAAFSRLFGTPCNKENIVVPRYYRDLEHQLAAEKMHIQSLSQQLSKAHIEISTLKSKENIKEIAKVISTPLGKSAKKLEEISSSNQSGKTRMRHKIPHRWNSHLVMRAGRCAGCMGSIPFSLKVARCQECRLLAHTKCCASIAHTCGLPQEFASHFTASYKSSQSKKTDDQIIKSGWIKVLKRSKTCWERRYAILSQCKLQFYEQKPVDALQPLKTFELKSCTISVSRSVYKSELPNSNSSELPFVLKVSFDAKKGRSTSAFILTQSFEEKRTWIKVLESLTNKRTSDVSGSQPNGTVLSENLLSLKAPINMDCNCMVVLNEQIILVGATEGLFSFELKKGTINVKSRINGLDSVQQIVIVKEIGIAVFVSGADNLVYVKDIQSLSTSTADSEPSFAPKLIPTLIGCHLIAASNNENSFLCAASSDRISILTWNQSIECFEVRREYGTLEPCSCLLFTENSLIVGAERFYKIDLINFAIEELLDEKDNTLAYVLYTSTLMSSYPVSVILISPPNATEEFLLAFYEFGIFVDGNGKKSRDSDVKFSSLPLGLSFIFPHLFILYENSIEIVEIKAESFIGEIDSSTRKDTTNVKSITKQFLKPRFLGDAPYRSGIVVATAEEDGAVLQTVYASFAHDPVQSSTSYFSMNEFVPEKASTDVSDALSLRSEHSLSEESSSSIGSTKRTRTSIVLRSPKKAKRDT